MNFRNCKNKQTPKRAIAATFLFFFFLTACDSSFAEFAPSSIQNCTIKFVLEKAQIVDQIDYQIYYIGHFKNDNTYTMKTNSPLYEEQQEKEGTYTYKRISRKRASISTSFLEENGNKISYVTELEFDNVNSGVWTTSGSPAFPDAEGGPFILTRQEDEQ